MPSYTIYCSRVDAKTFGWASMIPLSHLSFVQCEQVNSQPEKRVEIKVSHSAVAIGTVVGVGAAPYLRRSKRKVEPIPLLSLFYTFLMRNRYPFIAGLTESFPVDGWLSPGSNSRHPDDFLPHCLITEWF